MSAHFKSQVDYQPDPAPAPAKGLATNAHEPPRVFR